MKDDGLAFAVSRHVESVETQCKTTNPPDSRILRNSTNHAVVEDIGAGKLAQLEDHSYILRGC